MNYGRMIVTAELEALGIQLGPENDKGWASALCPLHEDSKPSFTVNLKEGAWRCRAGCGSHGDLAVLVEKITGESVQKAHDRMRARILADPSGFTQPFEEDEPDDLEDEEEAEPEPEPLFYDQARIPRYWMQRGFTMATGRRWKIGFDPEMPALVIPIFWNGELIGLIRRRIGEGDPKYRYTWGLQKSDFLFGMDKVPKGTRKVVVTEGALDAIWMHQCGYPAVAIMGSSMSEAQAQLLRRRFFQVILAFDQDKAGTEATDGARKLLSGVEVTSVRLPAGVKDVQECSPEVLKSVLAQAKSGWYSAFASNSGKRSLFYAQTADVATAKAESTPEMDPDHADPATAIGHLRALPEESGPE